MIQEIGELLDQSNLTLLKAWQVSVEPGKRPFRRHSHIRFEIAHILSGSGTYTVHHQQLPILPGDFFVFCGKERHCITEIGPSGLTLINLHFEPRYLWGSPTESFSFKNGNFCFTHSKSFKNRITGPNATVLAGYFELLLQELQLKPQEYPLAVKSYLNLMLLHLIRRLNYAQENAEFVSENISPIFKAMEYIDAHYTEPIKLSELAKEVQLSPNYFSALFHKINGITLWDYINTKRVEQAIHFLLEDKAKNILQIAMQCGFNNTANFNKTFKSVTLMTPSEYRKYGEPII